MKLQEVATSFISFIFSYLKLQEVATREDDEDFMAPPPQKKRRVFYTPNEDDIVKSYFNIEERTTTVKSTECAKFLKEHQKGELFKGRSVQNIQDKVKNFLKQKKRQK